MSDSGKSARSNRLSPGQRDEACRRYLAGEASTKIGREFGVSSVAICQLLKKRGITRRPPPTTPMHTEEEQAKICRLYLMGRHANVIAKEMGVACGTITKTLKRQGIALRPHSEQARTYNCNHGFFDAINTEHKAYWLGFIAADGYVSKPSKGSNPELCISLAVKDEEHLLRFKRSIQSTHPIRHYDYSDRGGAGKNYPYASVSIRSKQLTDALARFGIVSAKCHTFVWPKLPSPLERHFLRGYFDGDGYWNTSFALDKRQDNKKRTDWRIDIAFRLTSDRCFLVGCQQFLMRECNLNRTKLSNTDHRGAYSASTLIYKGRNQCRRIFHLMYDDATIYLPRKREVAEPLIT